MPVSPAGRQEHGPGRQEHGPGLLQQRGLMAVALVLEPGGGEDLLAHLPWLPSPLQVLQAKAQTGPGGLDNPAVTVPH